ncbi:PqqD family protein [Paraconexibacter sp.]|uniref:PqqD family protein n=1 Tax=Paraconexibacter sp. TaxID=2949640 RepID=UPI00356B43F0
MTTRPLKPADGVLAQPAHGETVLLRLSDGAYFTLDDVSAHIWEHCDGARTTEDLVEVICATFDAPPDVVRRDVRAFLDEMVSEGLLVEAP